ncbi:hypothetical protein [Candidatus Vidania fulgoroideorum]
MKYFKFLNSYYKEKKIKKNLSEFNLHHINRNNSKIIISTIRQILFRYSKGCSVEKIYLNKNNEFSTISGVDKNINEIIYSLKRIKFKLVKKKKIIVKIKEKGPKKIFSKDFENKYIKILSKNKKVLEISKNSKIDIAFKIGKGVGYKKAKKYNNKKHIYIDANYCPIDNIKFKIKKYKNYESLKIIVKTNKTVKPNKVLLKAFKIAKKLFLIKKRKIKLYNFYFNKIEENNFSKKINSIIKKKKIKLYGELKKNIKCFSKKQTKEIKKVFSRMK